MASSDQQQQKSQGNHTSFIFYVSQCLLMSASVKNIGTTSAAKNENEVEVRVPLC